MQTIVGVLRGGPSHEHDISLKTGATLLSALPREEFDVRDIYIDKSGTWFDRGRPSTPDRILRQIDVAMPGMHGTYGGDGTLQHTLESFSIPYSGSDTIGTRISHNKALAKMRAIDAGIATPDFVAIQSPNEIEEGAKAAMRMLQPVVVKPLAEGSSIGVTIVGGHAFVLRAIQDLFAQGVQGVLVEELVRGKEATVGIVDHMRGEPHYMLPVIEVTRPTGTIYTHAMKRENLVRLSCPGTFTRVEAEDLRRAAKKMHQALGLRHYSRSDFIVSPRGIYYLETNAHPSLAPQAPLPHALASIGVSAQQFARHLVNLARRGSP